MNPLDWSFPIAVTWLILFGIILARAGGTYLLGRLARTGIRKIDRVDKIMSGSKYRKAEDMIDRFGAPVIALSFLMIGVQTVLNLAAGTSAMRLRRYLPALVVGGSLWALIYSTVGLIGFKALARAYEVAPGLTIGVGACFVLAIGGLLIGLRKKDGAPEQGDLPSASKSGESTDSTDATDSTDSNSEAV